ncbi:MAG: hypothetical protein AAGG44_20030 [Planctomycetota bacterium]
MSRNSGILVIETKLVAYDSVERQFLSEHERAIGKPVREVSIGQLMGEPLINGELVEMYLDGSWISGTYRLDPIVSPEPSLRVGKREFGIEAANLLRRASDSGSSA